MSNRLQHESSPYLRQHAENPVDWYPWGEEAFTRAREEDKPVFLSIGYSTCHWCHVMAHESFEDLEVARILNQYFISIKLDKEERPDVDSVYMRVCQAFTGSGGWPTSIFMTPEKMPFFAGTYLPKKRKHGMIGFIELLTTIHDLWYNDRESLLEQADRIIAHLSETALPSTADKTDLIKKAVSQYEQTYDPVHGGFGSAPKFPTPHNLMFLLEHYKRTGNANCLDMTRHTLMQMYRGGLFDHVGGGFSRYSTDPRFLVPHFEKMLYDNALLIMTYSRAHTIVDDPAQAALFLQIAEQTAAYILREMASPEGGFYSAQDADSENEEGKFYVFTPKEIEEILPPKDFAAFCQHYNVNQKGNFEGKNILNLLNSDPYDGRFAKLLNLLYAYRQKRYSLHLDDKILTSWNALMIAAMCELYLASGKQQYLDAAREANRCINQKLRQGDVLYTSYASGKRGAMAFLDDYAACCFAQLALYRATLEQPFLDDAQMYCRIANQRFTTAESAGYFFSGHGNEPLILKIKETYDGAIPSGNSLMAWNLVRLWQLIGDDAYHTQVQRQLAFMASEAAAHPMGYGMFLLALQEFQDPPAKVIIVSEEPAQAMDLIRQFPPDTLLRCQAPSGQYALKNGKTTYYMCSGHQCQPPVNDLQAILAPASSPLLFPHP
ncbi:MAG: thioredoxin domain-containing protein [Clostridiales bacterium]|nr:thioredoxin domain-containing protein [Clostridiales bacterium]